MEKKKPLRTIVVGDIHGCYDEFQELLQKTSYKEGKDRLILVGDIINKGPKSYEMIEWLMMNPTVICLMGNHEWAFLEYLQGEFSSAAFDELSKKLGNDIKSVIKWLKELPLFYEDDDMLIVHAGMRPDQEIEKQPREILTTIRTWDGRGEDLKNPNNPAWFDFYHGDKVVIFGHWAAKGLIQKDNLIGLDSGCVYGKQLSAFIFPQRQIIQVQAMAVYQNINM